MKCNGAILTKSWLQKELYKKKKKYGVILNFFKKSLNY